VVEQFPRMEGRQMVMVLSPRKKEVAVKPKEAKPRVATETDVAPD
jgi:translation initiation factor IF-3